MLHVDELFEETRLAMLSWQGQYNKKCNKAGNSCSVVKEGWKCYQRKVNGKWYCSDVRM
jgi:hypothetical protein